MQRRRLAHRFTSLCLASLAASACGASQSQTTATSELATNAESAASPRPSSPPPSSSSPPPASPFANAPEVARSEAYRFALNLPREWLALTPEQLLRIHRDARVGYSSPDGTFIGAVVASPLERNATFQAAADRWATALRGDGARVVGVERTRFGDHDAVHARIEMQSGGSPVLVDAMVFARDRHLVAVQAMHTAGAAYNPEAFFAAYRDIPGALTTADVDVAITTAEGPGWRVHDRRFEDFVAGLVAELPEGWSFLDRWSTRDLGTDVGIAMKADGADHYAFVTSEHVPAAAQTRWRAAIQAESAARYPAASGRPPESIAFDTTPLSADVLSAGERELLLAATCRGDTCVTVGMQWAASEATAAHERLAHGAPRFRWMTPAERAAGARHMPGATHDVHLVGVDESLHAGRYTDYAHGVRFTLPERGVWNVQWGREATQSAEHLQFMASDLTTDVRLALAVETVAAGTTDAAFHATMREHLHAPVESHPRERRIGAVHVLESDIASLGEARVTYRAITAVRGTTAVRFEVAGIDENMQAARRLVDEIMRSFDVAPGPIDRGHRDGDRYVADQLGYSIRIPADWTHEGSPFGDGLYADRWSHGEKAVFVFAQGPSDRPDGARGEGLLMETLRTLDPATPAESAWQASTSSGHPARIASWSDGAHAVRALRVARDRTGYLVFATDDPPGSGDAVARSFEFVR